MGVINFVSKSGRAQARFLDAHGAEMDDLKRRVEEAPALIDVAEAAGASVKKTIAAVHAQDWEAAVEIVRAHELVVDSELDPFTRAHRDAVVGLLEEKFDLAQTLAALEDVRRRSETVVEELFDRGEKDLQRLAELEHQWAVASGTARPEEAPTAAPTAPPVDGGRSGAPLPPPVPGAAAVTPAPQVHAVPPMPPGVLWGRKAVKRAPELWPLIFPLMQPGEWLQVVVALNRKRPQLDVLVITNLRFLAFDSAVVAVQGPEILRPRTDASKVAVGGFAERVVVTTVDGDEIDCGPLAHSGDRDLVLQHLLPPVKMSWEE